MSEVRNVLVSRKKNSFHNSVKCIGSVFGMTKIIIIIIKIIIIIIIIIKKTLHP